MAPAEWDSADRVAAAARAVPGVHDLHAGMFGEAATYLPGRRVTGVAVGENRVAVHIVADLDRSEGNDLTALAEAVRRAVVPLADGAAVDVIIEDLHQSARRDAYRGA
ncbi:MAG: hypothetical protein ACR2F6_19450 [Mycobacteriales bacterium]